MVLEFIAIFEWLLLLHNSETPPQWMLYGKKYSRIQFTRWWEAFETFLFLGGSSNFGWFSFSFECYSYCLIYYDDGIIDSASIEMDTLYIWEWAHVHTQLQYRTIWHSLEMIKSNKNQKTFLMRFVFFSFHFAITIKSSSASSWNYTILYFNFPIHLGNGRISVETRTLRILPTVYKESAGVLQHWLMIVCFGAGKNGRRTGKKEEISIKHEEIKTARFNSIHSAW